MFPLYKMHFAPMPIIKIVWLSVYCFVPCQSSFFACHAWANLHEFMPRWMHAMHRCSSVLVVRLWGVYLLDWGALQGPQTCLAVDPVAPKIRSLRPCSQEAPKTLPPTKQKLLLGGPAGPQKNLLGPCKAPKGPTGLRRAPGPDFGPLDMAS